MCRGENGQPETPEWTPVSKPWDPNRCEIPPDGSDCQIINLPFAEPHIERGNN